jgi:hypothetical protein
MLSRIVMIAIVAGLLADGATSGAQAQQPVSLGQQAGNPSGWTFNVAPYLWFAHINTTMNLNLPPALGGTVSAGSTIGFGDLVSHLNFGLMVAADAQHDKFSLLTDFMYMNLAAPLPSGDPPDPWPTRLRDARERPYRLAMAGVGPTIFLGVRRFGLS